MRKRTSAQRFTMNRFTQEKIMMKNHRMAPVKPIILFNVHAVAESEERSNGNLHM